MNLEPRFNRYIGIELLRRGDARLQLQRAPASPPRNRPETLVAVAEWRDGRLDGSGGTNPARRFWTRLLVALRPHSNSGAAIPTDELEWLRRGRG
jgi:hypothetical protein